MLEAKIRDLFEQVSATDQPPASVSIVAAAQRGRSLLRWRRVRLAGAPVLAASAAVAIALTGALPLGTSPPTTQQRPTSQQARAASGAAQAPVAAPAQFSPLQPYASFGWLPSGESVSSGDAGPIGEMLNVGSGKQLTWQLSVYAAGQCDLIRHDGALVCSQGNQILTVPLAGPAPAVNGRTAFWAGLGQSAETRAMTIVWQYAAGGWAELSSAASLQPPSLPLRIARDVVFGAAVRPPFEFPAQLTRVPADWQVSSVAFGRVNGVLSATAYSVTAGSVVTGSGNGVTGTDLPDITILTRTGDCAFYNGGQSVHRLINGYASVVNTIPPQRGDPLTSQVCVSNANGLFIIVSVSGSHPVIDPVTLFRHMKLLGTDPANWTTRPFG
jgi:hypothetical protein